MGLLGQILGTAARSASTSRTRTTRRAPRAGYGTARAGGRTSGLALAGQVASMLRRRRTL